MSETLINSLFLQLEEQRNFEEFLTKWEHSAGVELDCVWVETLRSISETQKRLVRAMLRAGLVGELMCHVKVGTLPPYAIRAAFNRIDSRN